MPTRLNKFLAHNFGISRREADELIAKKSVTVNGEIAELGRVVEPNDDVQIKGKTVNKNSSYTYLQLNKPVGYVCSRKKQGDNPTIYSLLPERYHHLKPVGRLDKDSSGLLLLTDNGDFAHRMTHPSFRKTKVYTVELDTPLAPLHQQMISDRGVQLEDGVSKFTVSSNGNGSYEVTMSEGRNRQIRRTFATLGYTVTKLHRHIFGPFSLEAKKATTFHEINP